MEGIEWVNSLTNYERRMPGKYTGKAFSTDRYKELLSRLGSPERIGIPTVQILGTDGKGSTLALLESFLLECGRRVSSFISPHLVDLEERFRVDGRDIPRDLLDRALLEVRHRAMDLADLTFFEALNAAFWCSARNDPPHFVLLETGLGGRLDTTTICEPTLKILTRLERDHIGLLGRTMNRIADEKILALVPGVPTVISPQARFLRPYLKRHLDEHKIPAVWAGEDAESEILNRSVSGWSVRVGGPAVEPGEFLLGLLGDHQAENLLAALLALHLLGLQLPPIERYRSVNPRWWGRCQVAEYRSGFSAVLDGSHTPMGGQALRRFLDQVDPWGAPRTFAFSCARERFPWCYLRGLVRPKDRLVLVDWEYFRLWKAQELREALLAERWTDFETPELEILPASDVFRCSARAGRPWIHCGSFYWVGRVLKEFTPMSSTTPVRSNPFMEGV